MILGGYTFITLLVPANGNDITSESVLTVMMQGCREIQCMQNKYTCYIMIPYDIIYTAKKKSAPCDLGVSTERDEGILMRCK